MARQFSTLPERRSRETVYDCALLLTLLPTDEGWLYLAGLKDVFTCEIVGYAMGARMTTELVSQALFRAVQQKRPAAGLIHHTDSNNVSTSSSRVGLTLTAIDRSWAFWCCMGSRVT